jgi:hypothetical protein
VTRRKPMGYSLGGTMIFLVLVALLWEGVFFQMAGYLRAEKVLSEYRTGRQGCSHALAWALALLETGVPPENPYVCRMAPTDDPADIYVATFQRAANLRYTVTVRPATEGDELLPSAPSSFSVTQPGRGGRVAPGIELPRNARRPRGAVDDRAGRQGRGRRDAGMRRR